MKTKKTKSKSVNKKIPFSKNNRNSTLREWIQSSLVWLATISKLKWKDTTLVLEVASKILIVLESRGIAEAIKYTKDLRLKFTKVMLSIDPVTFERGDQLWLPKSFIPILRRIQEERSYPLIRLIFTSLYITRSLRLDGEISFETITKGPAYSGNLSVIESEIPLFLKDLGVNLNHIGKPPKSLRFKEFHMSSKSGPNGHALWTSYKDILTLTNIQRYAIKLVGGEKLDSLMDKFSNLYKQIPIFFDNRTTRKGRPISRRITKILDKEGKIREVAIGDYYTQAALLPLHNFLYKVLKRIDQDCTSEQTKQFYKIENSIGSSYHSIDLKSFTDRFPIDINHRILSVWFGSEYAHAWKELMVGTPFDYKGQEITYATGNPMGLYSSFNSTALAHHFIVWLACKRANLRWKRSRYMLLGDDIVIANDNLAKHYRELLSEWGVEIQHSKSHISKHGFEFAKQIRLHGCNVSPFPLSALYERRSEAISSLGIILQEFKYKRWDADLQSALKNYYISVWKWSRPKFKAFQPVLNLVISFLRYLQGDGLLGKAITAYVKSRFAIKKVKWAKKSNKVLFEHWIAVKVVQQLYIDSRERIVSKNTKGSLGDLATEMVCHITSLRDGGADCFDLIEAVPFLQVYGRAEEIYLKSFDNYYDYGMGSQPKQLREHIGKVDIPLSDDGFYVRHRDVLVVQSMKASKIITNLLNTTKQVSAYNGRLIIDVPWADAMEIHTSVPGKDPDHNKTFN